MAGFLTIIGILVACCLLFVLTHLRPLAKDEIDQLARIRRSVRIDNYYAFHYSERNVNLDFKKAMKAQGSFYPIQHALSEFPSIAAGMLKYKKHEWVIIAFEKGQTVGLIWLNKGPDNKQVFPFVPISQVVETAQRREFTTVLWFHNHPNPNPSRYVCHRPSNPDLKSAQIIATELNAAGINLVEFVCERGSHHEYCRSIADTFFPHEVIRTKTERTNGVSWSKNFSMHWERLFASARQKSGYSSAGVMEG